MPLLRLCASPAARWSAGAVLTRATMSASPAQSASALSAARWMHRDCSIPFAKHHPRPSPSPSPSPVATSHHHSLRANYSSSSALAHARGGGKDSKADKGRKKGRDDNEDDDEGGSDAAPVKLPDIGTIKQNMQSAVDFGKKELGKLRSGRTTPAILDSVRVRGQALAQHAQVSVKDANTLIVNVLDEQLASEIEKAIAEADLDVTPVRDGKVIRCTVPKLTAEYKEKLCKQAKEKGDAVKERIRRVRNNAVTDSKKATGISKDEIFKFEKDITKIVEEFSKQVDAAVQAKTKEISSI